MNDPDKKPLINLLASLAKAQSAVVQCIASPEVDRAAVEESIGDVALAMALAMSYFKIDQRTMMQGTANKMVDLHCDR